MGWAGRPNQYAAHAGACEGSTATRTFGARWGELGCWGGWSGQERKGW